MESNFASKSNTCACLESNFASKSVTMKRSVHVWNQILQGNLVHVHVLNQQCLPPLGARRRRRFYYWVLPFFLHSSSSILLLAAAAAAALHPREGGIVTSFQNYNAHGIKASFSQRKIFMVATMVQPCSEGATCVSMYQICLQILIPNMHRAFQCIRFACKF